MRDVFFGGWDSLGRVLLVGVLAYAGLLLLLRVTGKRTLSKMNAFDFVVTVALGSTLATTLLSKQVALAEGLLAFAVLVLLQLAVTWTSVRWPAFQSLIKAQPTLLVHDGRLLRDRLRGQRVSEEEVLAAVREHGLSRIEDVAAAVLETDGSVSVIGREVGLERASALRYVAGLPSRERTGAGAP